MKEQCKEHKLPIGITKTWFENGHGDGIRKTYVIVVYGGEEHATWRWLIQDKCMNAATWSFPNTQKMRQDEGEQVSHNSLSIRVE